MVGMSERVRHSLVVAVSPKFPIETGPGCGHASPLNEFGACRSTHLDELPGGHREVLRREGELCRRHRVGRWLITTLNLATAPRPRSYGGRSGGVSYLVL